MLSPDNLPISHRDFDLGFGSPRPSLDTIEGRRRETHAIRQLWHSLQAKKHRFRHHHDVLSRISSARGHHHHHTTNFPPQALISRFTESAPPTYYNNNSHRQKSQQPNSEEIPIHTAITKRPAKQHSNLERFNALTRKVVLRLPNVYDRPLGLPSYTSQDIREWKNEVTKIVPRRPAIYTMTSSEPRDMTLVLPPESKTTNDSLCMFQPVSPRRKGRGKEYVVNPEWPSEDITPKSVRDRAHCVYTWPI